MTRVDQGFRFRSLDDLEGHIRGIEPGEPIEMDRVQYSDYKTLVWEWLRQLNPIMVFRGHPIVVIKRGEEALSTGADKLTDNVI